jgi:hypothetical protein
MDVAIARDGLFAAGMSDGGQTLWDGWLLKRNWNGAPLWRVSYREPGSDQAKRVSALPDGGCIVSGFVVRHDGDVWLERRNAQGALLWRREFGVKGRSDAAFGQAVRGDRIALAGTGFVACWTTDGTELWNAATAETFYGTALDADENVWAVGENGALLKLSANGEPVLERTLTAGLGSLWLRDVVAGEEGDVYLAGMGTDLVNRSVAVVMRYHPQAGIIWAQIWRPAEKDASAIRLRRSQSYVMAAGAEGADKLEIWLRQFDAERGGLIDGRLYSAAGDAYAFGFDVTEDGWLALGGFFEGSLVLDGWTLLSQGRDGFEGLWSLPIKD